MPRVKGGYTTRKRRKAVLKMAKGYYGSKNTLYKTANEQVMRSLAYAYRDRKDRKRQFRKLWVTRINAAATQNGIKYSRFMSGLSKAGIEINRKMLAEMAVNDKEGFKNLVEVAKKNVDKATVKVEENIVVLTRSQIAPTKETPLARKETVTKKEAVADKKETVPKIIKEERISKTVKEETENKKDIEEIIKKNISKQVENIETGTSKKISAHESAEGVKIEIIINKKDPYCLYCLTVAQLKDVAEYYELADISDLRKEQLILYIEESIDRGPGLQVQVSINESKSQCLECFKLSQLRDLAKIMELTGYSTMRKDELLKYIIDFDTGVL